MKDFHKSLETLANVAIIVVAVLIGTAFAVKYFAASSVQPAAQNSRLAPGSKLEIGQIDWSTNDKNLVLAFSTKCRFCLESMDFYQRLLQERKAAGGFRLIVVSAQPVEEIRAFFAERQVLIDEFVQAQPSDINIGGTPTLVLIDRNGIVSNSWVGRLPAGLESEVISSLF